MVQYIKRLDNLGCGITLYTFTHLMAQVNYRDKTSDWKNPFRTELRALGG